MLRKKANQTSELTIEWAIVVSWWPYEIVPDMDDGMLRSRGVTC